MIAKSSILGILNHIANPLRSLSSKPTPSRSILYVPANDEKKLKKIFATNADCVVLDCEDGVALNRKKQARENIRKLFTDDIRVQSDRKYTVRINAPQTSLAHEDIKNILDAEFLPKTLFIPKANYDDDVKWLFETMYKQLANNNFKATNQINLFFYMESAASLINLRDIIQNAIFLSSQKYKNIFRLEGFVFGSDDYCADIGAERTKDAFELTYARQKLITYCKAFKLKAIDMVYIDFKDLEGLKIQSQQGARMGFTGKQVIHPGQVDVTQEAFTPSEEKIKWARGLIEAFKAHQASGSGAFTYEGQMIDMPSLLQAENVLEIIDQIKKD